MEMGCNNLVICADFFFFHDFKNLLLPSQTWRKTLWTVKRKLKKRKKKGGLKGGKDTEEEVGLFYIVC